MLKEERNRLFLSHNDTTSYQSGLSNFPRSETDRSGILCFRVGIIHAVDPDDEVQGGNCDKREPEECQDTCCNKEQNGLQKLPGIKLSQSGNEK